MRRAAAAAAAAASAAACRAATSLGGAAPAGARRSSSAPDAFPTHPSALTAAWLTEALTAAGRIPCGATVRRACTRANACFVRAAPTRTRFSVAPVCCADVASTACARVCSSFEGAQIGAGVGLASLLTRLTLRVSPPGGGAHDTFTAVAKFPPTDPQARAASLRA
jgi:hypothetical protein